MADQTPDQKQLNLLTDPKAGEGAKPNETPPKPGEKDSKPQGEEKKDDAGLLTSGKTGEPKEGEPKGTETPPQPLTLKPPVGVDPNDAGFLKFKAFAESKKLTQEQAQEALEFYVGAVADNESRTRSTFAAKIADWAGKSKGDPEFGGEKLAPSLAVAKGALDKFGTQGLKEVLDQTGLSSHPEVIRFFTRVGKVLQKEDTFLGTALRTQQKPASEEELLRKQYPSMFPHNQE